MRMADDTIPKLLLSAKEAAAALAICEKTLWSYTAPRGAIPAVRIGKRCLYDVRDLLRAVDSMKGGEFNEHPC